MEYQAISQSDCDEETDSRCLTCWALLDRCSVEGYQLFCGHWLCWTCLEFLRSDESEALAVSTCFRCLSPISISPALDVSPKAAFRFPQIFSRKRELLSESGNTSPVASRPAETTKTQGFWKRLVQGKSHVCQPKQSYGKLLSGDVEESSDFPFTPASSLNTSHIKEKKTRHRLSLNLF